MNNNEIKKQLARWISSFLDENDSALLLVFDDDFLAEFVDYLMERGVTVSFLNTLKEQ